jgi:hypothetical protein
VPRKSFSPGPTGTNRVNLDAPHLVRCWRAELGCDETDLRDAVAAVGTQAADVRRYLERRQRARAQSPTQPHTVRP